MLTDHKTILDLFKKHAFMNNLKFNRWFISVLEFVPEFKFIPDQLNTVANGLLRAQEDNEKALSTHSFCFSYELLDLNLEVMKSVQENDKNIQRIV